MKTAIQIVAAAMALLLAAAALPAQQAAIEKADAIEYPPVYRVELVVFAHAEGRSDRIRSEAPVDFTGRLDPLLLARANKMAERQLSGLAGFLPVARVPGDTDETTPWLETEAQTLRPIPPVYSALGDLSRPIQRAFDRLIDAPQYEPLVARTWIQLAQRGQPTATLRIHDQSVVNRIEPEFEVRLVPPPHVLPFGPLVEKPPPVLDIYQLDGTVGLRQRQFLHLDLNLVWQAPARALAERTSPSPDSHAEGVDSGPASGKGDWALHRLQQSRIVQPGRLEYFDSSLLGVLVRIERFRQVVPAVDKLAPDATDPASVESGDPVTDSGR